MPSHIDSRSPERVPLQSRPEILQAFSPLYATPTTENSHQMYNRPNMSHSISRRTALGAFVASAKALAQPKPLEIAGKPIEVTLTPITSHTARITIQPIENGQPKPVPLDGALVKE